ncbi:MAG: hypothetical protein DWQ01_06530 [Planctomycetota bacterium]|nr:MAG: hypothetical protein DWQ01_06530 [Planctomycetota bacterium]
MSTTSKIDLFKLHKQEYAGRRKPYLVEIGPVKYLAIQGKGAPGGTAFQEAIGRLYAVAYTMKMQSKAAGQDYVVAKMEAQWYGEDGDPMFHLKPKEEWCWKFLIRVPEFIEENHRQEALDAVRAKKKVEGAEAVTLEVHPASTCVQAMHVGPYSECGIAIKAMLELAQSQGYIPRGPHHEIYFSDPRRVPEERLKTLLRYRIQKP